MFFTHRSVDRRRHRFSAIWAYLTWALTTVRYTLAEQPFVPRRYAETKTGKKSCMLHKIIKRTLLQGHKFVHCPWWMDSLIHYRFLIYLCNNTVYVTDFFYTSHHELGPLQKYQAVHCISFLSDTFPRSHRSLFLRTILYGWTFARYINIRICSTVSLIHPRQLHKVYL